MKLIAEIDGESFPVEVRREGGGRVFAEVDGRRYELEVREPEPGVLLFIRDGRVSEVRHGDGTEVRTPRRSYDVRVRDPRRLRGARDAAGQGDGHATISAPMPGKVVRVLVEEGASVEAGDGLVVVEAMKMQNELKSPKAGKVARVSAEPGATVKAGDVLVVIE